MSRSTNSTSAYQSDSSVSQGVLGGATDRAPLHAEEWGVFSAKSRLDAFSHDLMVAEIRSFMAAGCVRIAIDMRGTRFMSLPSIHYLVGLSRSLLAQGGALVLVAPNDKTQRHFEIYGSLKTVLIVRSLEDLPGQGLRPRTDVGELPLESS